jgi:hypothetical protein
LPRSRCCQTRFLAASVETVDVTDALVKAFNPDEKTLKAVAEVRQVKPFEMMESVTSKEKNGFSQWPARFDAKNVAQDVARSAARPKIVRGAICSASCGAPLALFLNRILPGSCMIHCAPQIDAG